MQYLYVYRAVELWVQYLYVCKAMELWVQYLYVCYGTMGEVSVCILPMCIQAVEPTAKAYMHTRVWNDLNRLYRIVENHRTVLCGMNMNYEMR